VVSGMNSSVTIHPAKPNQQTTQNRVRAST
jgi:hypothetical protein